MKMAWVFPTSLLVIVAGQVMADSPQETNAGSGKHESSADMWADREAESKPAADGDKRATPAGRLKMTGLEKYVSPQATFALCRPKGWKVLEDTQNRCLAIKVEDPTGQYQVGMVCGVNLYGDDRGPLVKAVLEHLRRQYKNFEMGNVREAKDKQKIVFDVTYKGTDGERREGRCWLSFDSGNFVFSYCATPAGRFLDSRATLLSILENIRILKNTIPKAPEQVRLVGYRLPDGSARFLAPPGWNVQGTGAGHFVATDPTERYSFIVAKVDMLTPQLGVSFPGAIVLPYMAPSQAMRSLTVPTGLLKDFKFEEVTEREDVARMIGQVYTVGEVKVEEFVYAGTGKAGRSRVYTFGISWGTRMGTNWTFTHLTGSAPAEKFSEWAPTLARMVQSYRIDDEFAARYVAEGTARLRRMQEDTARIIAKNADDIHNMMQEAYDERQRSQDYIDYQRTTYIRGETDWISNAEGGTIYHSDNWGTKNTTTGEAWEGTPYNYVNFEGRNPKYNEQMAKIDSRELYEQAFGKRSARP